MARAIIILISCGLLPVARPAPSVVSINLCTDQLLLNVAEAEQILSLSWLATDADESMLADAASHYDRNFGTAEEIIRLAPDVVIAGRYSNPYTKALLRRLGFTVVEIDPARSIADIENNLRQIGTAIDALAAADAAIATMRAHIERLRTQRDQQQPTSAIVIRPGGYTIERESIAGELLTLAGISDRALSMGLDNWGSLTVETLLRADPQMLVISDYKLETASLANTWYAHPAIADMMRERHSVLLPVSYWACGAPQSINGAEILLDTLAANG